MDVIQRLFGSKVAERAKRKVAIATGFHWQVKKLRPNVSSHFQTACLLRNFHIDTVIDVGANEGQFAEGLIDFGFAGRLVSFEPVIRAHGALQRRARRHRNWCVYRRCALGSQASQMTINVSRASVFSSLLEIEPAHTVAKPASRIVESQHVEVLTLDSIANELSIVPQNTLLKVDTQGYERQVIEGAEHLIASGLAGIKIEMPLFPIYKGTEWIFDDIYHFMLGNDFILHAINAESVDAASGITNTLDGTFFTRSIVERVSAS